MELQLSPVRHDARPHMAVDGDVLTIDAAAFDLSQIAEGDLLPAAALASPWFVGPVTREAGALRVTLMLSHGEHAPPETLFPEPVTVGHGPVPLPQHGDLPEAVPALETAAAPIDWTMLVSASDRAAQALAERRAVASLSRIDFALAVWQAELITEAEMDAWLSGGALPAVAAAALAGIEDETLRTVARARFVAAMSVERTNPFLSLLQAQAGLTDAQVDALFGIEP